MRNLNVLANCCTVLMILFILFSFLTKDVIHSNISAFLAIILGVFILKYFFSNDHGDEH